MVAHRHRIPKPRKRPPQRRTTDLPPLVPLIRSGGSRYAMDRHARRKEHFLLNQSIIEYWCKNHDVWFLYVKGSCAWKFRKGRLAFANFRLTRGYLHYCSDHNNWSTTAWSAKCNSYIELLAHLEQWVKDIPIVISEGLGQK